MSSQKNQRKNQRISFLTKVISLVVSLLVCSMFAGIFPVIAQVPGTAWLASDALGRVTGQDDPAEKENRHVGLFYFLWHGEDNAKCHWNEGPYDLSKLLRALPPEEQDNPETSTSDLWGEPSVNYYWGEPLFGYYSVHDPWILRRHLQLFIEAGVDFLFFDTSNAETFPDAYIPLCEMLKELQAEGESVPKVTFMLNLDTNRCAEELWKNVYGNGKYDDLLLYVDGKPLLYGDPDQIESEEIKEHLTFRRAHWPNVLSDSQDAWHWEAAYPQPYSWTISPDIPEQVNVSVAQNLHRSDELSGAYVSDMSSGLARGRSYRVGGDGPMDNDTPYYSEELSGQGINFAQQWERALELDPPYVMITGWNELFAGRQSRGEDRWVFVDEFSPEYSRDIEPMRGALLDNYYLQMIDGIRRYKGAPAIPVAGPKKTMAPGDFSAWNQVAPELRDHLRETAPRDFAGCASLRYKNNSGRNDIALVKAARDDQAFYFYVQTVDPITPNRPDGLCILLDTDGDLTNGFIGGDYLIGRSYQEDSVSCEKSLGGWQWKSAGSVSYWLAGNEIVCRVPYEVIGLDAKNASFETIAFKVLDNLEDPDGQICVLSTGEELRHGEGVTPAALYTNGDVAPESRFFFRLKDAE